MEQNPTWVRLQPDPVGTDYSVIFKVTEQESEGDETTSQDWEEGRMGPSGLVGAMSQHTIYLTWRTQLSLAKWSRRANRGHMGDVCAPRDKDKVVARGQSRHCPGPAVPRKTGSTRLDPKS